MAKAKDKKEQVLYVAIEAAETPDGLLRKGQIAEEGSKILTAYAQFFKPLEITYKA